VSIPQSQQQKALHRIPNSRSVDDLLVENKELKVQVMVEVEKQYNRLSEFSIGRMQILRGRKLIFDQQQDHRMQARQKVEVKKDHVREEIRSMRSKIVHYEDKGRLLFYENLLAQKEKAADLVLENNY